MQLTLLVPELVWPEPDDCQTLDTLACGALNTLIARSRFTRRPPQSLEATLTDACGLPAGAPYAALRCFGESTPAVDITNDAYWICADPVHLRFLQERLILADSSCLGIELDEAHAIADELNRQFSEIGTFHVASAERWYLQLSSATDLGEFDVPPLSAIAGRSVERQLPATPQMRGLRQWLNEAQMVLHGHPVNAARDDSGRMPINSLWLWGGGRLPQQLPRPFDSLWSALPLAVGLGRAAGIPTRAVPPDAATFLASVGRSAPGSRHLVLLEDLLGPVQYENGDGYRSALQKLENDWFAPLRQALISGPLKQLRLESSTAYGALCWQSTPVEQWKLWRRTQPLATVAQNLAKVNPIRASA
jgi:hypothetical protein